MLLIRHLTRLAADLVGYGVRGHGRGAVLLVLIGGPIVLLIGAVKIAGLAALYPFL
jgi:hypothetical protein